LYFTFGGHAGIGERAGVSSSVTTPTAGQTFNINDFAGVRN